MEKRRKIALIAKKLSFAEAEEATIEYYAKVDWKESARTVEEMRKGIWNNEYEKGMEKIIRKSTLKRRGMILNENFIEFISLLNKKEVNIC